MMEFEYVPQKVWTPLTGFYEVISITDDIDHIGNRIAEGRLHPSLFWPELAKAWRRDAVRETAKHYQSIKWRESREYAASWVDRWLEFHDRDEGRQVTQRSKQVINGGD